MRKRHSRNHGFTLVEITVVLVILAILMAVAVMNFTNAQHRARVASIKSNMHAFETLLVVYSSDWQGAFPADKSALETEGQAKGYWKDFDNPYLTKAGSGISYTDESGGKTTGIVTYDPVSPANNKYYIYSYDQYLQRIQQGGQDFVLTNS